MPRFFRLLIIFAFPILLDQTLTRAAETSPNVCIDVVENFCSRLWSPPNFGNLDLSLDGTNQQLRFGKTPNDINYSEYQFLKALESNIEKLPTDFRMVIEQRGFLPLLRKFINRKPRSELILAELSRPEWSGEIMRQLDQVLVQVALARTEHKLPGYIREPTENRSPDQEREYEKQVDAAWSELFTTVWINHPAWAAVKSGFERIRKEYINWVETDTSIPPALRDFWLEQLRTLRLIIPGSNPRTSSFRKWCGIDEKNAFYSYGDHEITVCAGAFNSGLPLQTIAHETGHALGINRRILRYSEDSPLGRSLHQLWDNSVSGKHFSCEEWGSFKKKLEIESAKQIPYVFEDASELNTFVTKTLAPAAQDIELDRLAERFARDTSRAEIKAHCPEKLMKQSLILESGREAPNSKYLSPHQLTRWPVWSSAVNDLSVHYEMFFTEEFHCQSVEKKQSDPVALEKALSASRDLIKVDWKLTLRVASRYSRRPEMMNEGFSQDIEEDVVDSYGSKILSRILREIRSPEDRSATYLSTVAEYCNPPSFSERYPDEIAILRKFTTEAHSVGRDRRLKLLTPQIRSVLGCK